MKDVLARFAAGEIPFVEALESATGEAETTALYDLLFAQPVPQKRPSNERTNYLRALNNACVLAAARGDKQRAAALADRARPFFRENPFLTHSAACAYVAVGRLDDALACAKRAAKYEYRRLGSLRIDPDLAAIRERPGFPKLTAADRAPLEALETEMPAVATLNQIRQNLWRARPRWSEQEWHRVYVAALRHLQSDDVAIEKASWKLLCEALGYGIDELRDDPARLRVFALLRPTLEPMFRRTPDRLAEFARDADVKLLALPALQEWLRALPHSTSAQIVIRRRTGAAAACADFIAHLNEPEDSVRITAAEELANACIGGFFAEPALTLDAETLQAVFDSEVRSPGIIWAFLGAFWRQQSLDVIAAAAGRSAKDWVFSLLAESPESWVYEEFFSTLEDVVRLLQLEREHEAKLAALEYGLDFEAARRAAEIGTKTR